MDTSAHPRVQVCELVTEIVGRLHRCIDRAFERKGIPKDGANLSERHKEKVVEMILCAFTDDDPQDDESGDADDGRLPASRLSSETAAWLFGYMWLVELVIRAGDEFPQGADGLMPEAPMFETLAGVLEKSMLRGFTADDASQVIAETLSDADGGTETIELLRMLMAAGKDAVARVMN